MEEKLDFARVRKLMVENQLISRGIRNKKVIDVFLKIPREKFVPEHLKEYAYEDGPLSIGKGQTISQPYIVALMTEALDVKGGEKVLEVGTGSGYQSAILAEMGCEVYSIERIPELARTAKKVLEGLGYNVKIKVGDGTLGWDEFSPYDRIVVTAAGPEIPPSLYNQLKDGGIIIMPVGDRYFQDLILVKKIGTRMERRSFGGCQFVPLIGTGGWKDEGEM
ncbi:MAG: protein-L-isoaspartate(D-aspartate) O-methyltransferase [Candidatus Omnitrophica bacterium]|nr:protein-L-isoaspartate(D-aspartate) O-methyltransferase [Candidatus Omnitrophota bacterium]MCM8776898.1 protein-L-isoaspartate(D-aspartate) O-methyltransferase [Candidatus Omnitrophota bacterium]